MKTLRFLSWGGILLATSLSFALLSSAQAGSATWDASPATNEWTTATNWMPNTVPNGPDDVATFANSAVTTVNLDSSIEVDSINFAPGADPYTFTFSNNPTLTISGAGVINNSGQIQTFGGPNPIPEHHNIYFYNNATAGVDTSYSGLALSDFSDNATAGAATITCTAGAIQFFDQATAANATLNIGIPGGSLREFSSVLFSGSSTAGQALIMNNGPNDDVQFQDHSSAGNATVITAPNVVGNNSGARIDFIYQATAAQSILIANGSNDQAASGGVIAFQARSNGGLAQVRLAGNAQLDVSLHFNTSVNIGSLDGAGTVFLGRLNLGIGNNNLSTSFSGVLQDGGEGEGTGGALTKLGSGTLTLSGASTYTGGTTIQRGTLILSNTQGSATGTGPVTATAGILSGGGTVAGAVTLNAGATALAPTVTGIPETFTTLGSFTFGSGSTFTYTLKSVGGKPVADKLVANGVNINGAIFAPQATLHRPITPRTGFTVIDNTSTTPISGTFSNLPDGQEVLIGGENFSVNYEGGDGNDLVLTAQKH